MFPNWGDMVKDRGDDVSRLVLLHKDRWEQWGVYINLLRDEGFEEIGRRKAVDWNKHKKGASEFKLRFVEQLAGSSSVDYVKDGRNQMIPSAWAKRTFYRERTKNHTEAYILLDASFGSLDMTSDLDINVVSTTPDAMSVWMKFTSAFVSNHGSARSFCEYWDSNIYYEPGVYIEKGEVVGKKRVDGEYVPNKFTESTVLSIPKLLMFKGFEWTTPSTALYELTCVDRYSTAYEKKKEIMLDGYVSPPCPERMTSETEQSCYEASLHFAESFRRCYFAWKRSPSAARGDAVRVAFLKYAVTKIEGLVSVTSLAVCKVFGDDIWEDFVEKAGKAEYLEPYMSGISAYEMLRNLQMHSHTRATKGGTKIEYKSKYANRLVYVLMHNDNLCCKHSRAGRFETAESYEYKGILKSNEADLRTISRAISFLLCFMDGEGCLNPDRKPLKQCVFIDPANTEVWVKNLENRLPDLCRQMKEYVEGYVKLSTGVEVKDPEDQEREATEYVKGLVK